MKEILSNLRLLGLVMFLFRRWIEVVRMPALVVIILSSVGLLFYWKEFSRTQRIWTVLILAAAVLSAIGI